MTVPGHVKFWFVGGIAMFFAMSLITSPDKYYTAAQADIETIYNAYGDNAGAEIVKDSNNMFNLIFSSTASGRAVDVMHNTPRKDAAFFGSEQMAAMHTNEILKTFKLEIYAFFLRMSIAARWIPVLAVLGFAAFIDGLVARKIKIEGYGFTSPGVQARMTHILIVLTGISAVFMYLPVALPIFWWPVSTIITVLCIRYVSSNMKQITT